MIIKKTNVWYKSLLIIMLLGILLIITGSFINRVKPLANVVSFWLTDPQHSVLFERQADSLTFSAQKTNSICINVNDKEQYQKIDGFGFTLTGGSAIVINKMSKTKRQELLDELFDTKGNHIGISYLRLSIGSSDMSDHVFSYDDLPAGQTDPQLTQFTLEEEKKDLIPLLHDILSINPSIKIMASPWSPPLWMKTNHNAIGGSLKPEYYATYAQYFIKYINEMAGQGIKIDAITVQNEPLHPGNSPSMLMPADEQNLFIKKYLGPYFKQNAIRTKIILYDHNLDRLDYPLSILDDKDTRKYVDGTAFHLYAGNIAAMSYVHQKYPLYNLYFTEQWVNSQDADLSSNLAWHVKNLIIGATRNWSRNVLEWNLATDMYYAPHVIKPGCDICMGGVTIIGDSVIRNPSYYIIAHAAKFVRPGSSRIWSDNNENLPNTAFINPQGEKILIVLNDKPYTQAFSINYHQKVLNTALNAGAVGTYVWN